MNYTNKNQWMSLLALRDEIGYIYGSEDLAVLLYILAKRERPKCVVELGTGLGVSSFWIAHAIKENGFGHLWTFDDGSHFENNFKGYFCERLYCLGRELGLEALSDENLSYSKYFAEMSRFLEVENYLTLLQETINFRAWSTTIPFLSLSEN
jgi:hypothetical protein